MRILHIKPSVQLEELRLKLERLEQILSAMEYFELKANDRSYDAQINDWFPELARRNKRDAEVSQMAYDRMKIKFTNTLNEIKL